MGCSIPNSALAFTGLTQDNCELNTPAQCDLTEGVPAYPRDPGENLFCYYQRLFNIVFTGGDTGDFLSKFNNLSELTNPATARTNLGLGSVLSDISALEGDVIVLSGDVSTLRNDVNVNTADIGILRLDVNNLGTLSLQNANSVSITGGSITGITDLAVADGGTGASTASGARVNLLPSLGGQVGKVLAVNGTSTDVEWITPSGGTSLVTVSSTPPVSPAIGDLWWDTTIERLKIWYDDGILAQWEDVGSSGGVSSVTASGVLSSSGGATPNITLSGVVPVANGGTGASDAGTARTNLGLGAVLGDISTLRTDVNTSAADISTLRTDVDNLGTLSAQNANSVSITGGSITGITDLAVADGGTGASTAANARTNLGLGAAATRADSYFLQTANNLSDTPSPSTARANLGVSASADVVLRANNFSDIGNVTVARANLGIGSLASQDSTLVNITGGTIQNTNLGIVVSNRAALRALGLLPAGTVVTELGYATAGDGGGGTWVVSRSDTTTVDNDGTLIVRSGSHGSTSTDQSFKRVLARYDQGPKNATVLNVRWFGAGTDVWGYSNATPILRAFQALYVGFDLPGGALYFPAGTYVLDSMVSFNVQSYKFDLFGDGASTEIAYAFPNDVPNLSANYSLLEFVNLGAGSLIRNFSVSNRPFVAPTVFPNSLVRFTGGAGWRAENISFGNAMTSGAMNSSLVYSPSVPRYQGPGGALYIVNATAVSIRAINILGCFGTAIYTRDSSVEITDCWLTQNSVAETGAFLAGVLGVRPTLWIESGDTYRVENLFVENGGPYRAFPGSTITSYGSYFIVDTGGVAHNMSAGDYIILNGATGNPAYNARWRVASVTASTFRINSAVAGNETGVYCTSLFPCILIGGGLSATNMRVSESIFRSIYTNQGGRQLIGAISMYFCGRGGYTCAGLLVDGVYADYGEASVFLHGRQESYTAAEALLNGIRHNGGPRTDFGDIRIELARNVSINSAYEQTALTAWPKDPGGASLLIPDPGPGNWNFPPITAIALSDGGAENSGALGLSDINVAGGTLQDVFRNSTLGQTSAAVSVAGTRLENIRVRGAGIDLVNANSTPLVLTSGATRFVTAGGVQKEVVNVDFWEGRSATTYPSANQTIANGVATYLNQFNSSVINDDGFWSAAAPSRLSITRPCFRVKVSAGVTFASPPGSQALLQLVRNGGAEIVASTSWGSGPYASLTSAPLTVVQGDFFEVLVQHSVGVPLDVLSGLNHTNFSVEVLK